MQPNRPQQPQSHYPQYAGPAQNSVRAAQAVAAALTNPYGQAYGGQFAYGQASHYAQAYAQYYNGAGPSHVTADGYTISSTYVPGTQYNNSAPYQAPTRPPAQKPQGHGGGQGQPGWYQPGSCRCTHPGCSFAGSKKALEIHMMDRHLIYPPGWDKRKKKNDWDADPSLKGKPIPIQGTSIKLDTPEAIEQWIAERKKRFPTAQNVDDKQRKMREAIERGQLPFDDPSHRKKRRRTDDGPADRGGSSRGRGQRGRGRGRGRGRAQDGGWEGRRPAEQVEGSATKPASDDANHATPTPTTAMGPDDASEDASSDSDSDGAPEVVSSKGPPGALKSPEEGHMEVEKDQEGAVVAAASDVKADAPQVVKKPRPKQPRRPLYNPFAQRPSLLRNLLLPEIRVTVSNLSQAIHFLVDNDFLDNVELKPGQASERMIEVVGEQPAPPPPPPPLSTPVEVASEPVHATAAMEVVSSPQNQS
ncbi:nuclear fragile X mental retardation-interacting protein 1-domain-containing protein [Trametes polyzona]|nr:nuclear fragile X mental retardation-interacting protein 1-domain-containing protein [Trametes polyzona]